MYEGVHKYRKLAISAILIRRDIPLHSYCMTAISANGAVELYIFLIFWVRLPHITRLKLISYSRKRASEKPIYPCSHFQHPLLPTVSKGKGKREKETRKKNPILTRTPNRFFRTEAYFSLCMLPLTNKHTYAVPGFETSGRQVWASGSGDASHNCRDISG